MSTVKRVAPDAAAPREDRGLHMFWVQQCLQDLAEGRHSVGCGCDETDSIWTFNGWDVRGEKYKPNACTEIVRCALEMRSYECEVGDA